MILELLIQSFCFSRLILSFAVLTNCSILEPSTISNEII
jgi:hypothetical protein